MRIPPSAIVMSLVAAVPFSLAIRDTITHRDRLAQRNDERQVIATDEQTELAFEAQREQQVAAEQALRDQERHAKASQLVGKAFVTPGPAFGRITLGGPNTDGDATVVLDAHDTVLVMSSKLDDDDAGCSTLAEVAAKTWGEPAHDHVWLDLATHHRASIGPECALELARFDEPIAWVAQLPLAAVGGSRAELAKRFASQDADPDAAWLAPGLDGDELTTLWPVYDVAHPDKLLGLDLSTNATPETARRVLEALAARIGTKPTHGDDDVYRWKSVRVEIADGNLRVVVGADDR